MAKTDKTRKPSFWLDTDVLIKHWAKHNNTIEAKGGVKTMTEEEQYEAYKTFCVELFNELIDTKDGDNSMSLLNPPSTIKAHMPKLDKDTKSWAYSNEVYAFMRERVAAKATTQLKVLSKWNAKIVLPYGILHRAWLGSADADNKRRAGLFMA